MIYSLAELKIEYSGLFGEVEKISTEYLSSGEPDLKIGINKEDIETEREIAEQPFPDRVLESTAFYRKLAEFLPKKQAFVLHSALFDVDGEGVAFGALSGTGKTTHMLLWQRLLGDRMTIVNGDKPIVRFIDEKPIAFGTPFKGKENFGSNTKTELKHICFIERSLQNSCEEISKEEALNGILTQVYMPRDVESLVLTMELINKLLSSCKLWRIKCNMDISAAETAYNAIFKEKKDEA
jgi:hypothetical protein